MLILSIDQSCETGSAAILDDQRVLVERNWADTHFSRQQLFSSLKSMLAEAELDLGAIRLYVVGVGPGSYSGLRVALTAGMAMAIPGKTTIYGITSAEGLAWQAAEAEGTTRVRIVGDARRDQWWSRGFRRCDAGMLPVDDWTLVHSKAFRACKEEVVATSDWNRIGTLLQATISSSAMLIARAILPDAAVLGRLAIARLAQGIASEPLEPVYLHPAVQAKSRHTNAKTSDCQAPGIPV